MIYFVKRQPFAIKTGYYSDVNMLSLSMRVSLCKILISRNFNPSQNVSPLLLLNGLIMATNEGFITCKCFK